MLNRKEIINRLKKSGVDPKAALKAILEEASYLVRVRKGDIHQNFTPTEEEEIAVINRLAGFGIEVFESTRLQKTLEDMSALLDDLNAGD